MALFSDATKAELAEDLGKAKTRLKNMKAKAEATMETAMEAFTTTGVAFGMGYARGRMTDPADEESFSVFGIPPDLLLGAGGHVLAFAGVFGKWDSIAHAGANGALAAYASFSGLEFGVKDREEAEGLGSAGVRGRQIGAGAQNHRLQGVDLAQQMATAAAASRAGA